jgi:tetratricopeptide (TPR) repeat protein
MAFSREKAVDLARKHAEKRQFKKAVQQYELLAQKGMANMADRLQLGEYYRLGGDLLKAMFTYLDVGKELVTAGHHVKAIAIYKHMLRLDPSLYPVHLAAARTYYAAGHINDAVSQYQEAIGVLSVRGRPLDRLRVIREVLELDPENVRARIRLAEDFAGEGAIEDAVKELRIAADVLDRAGHTDDYIRVAERLLFHAPDDLVTCRRLSELLLEAASPQQALPKLQVCFRAQPMDVDILEMLALAFEQVGQSHKALAVLKQIARIHDRNGLIVERNAALERVVELDPADRSALRALAGRPVEPVVELGFQELSFEEGEDDFVPERSGSRSSPPESPVAATDVPPLVDDRSVAMDVPSSNFADGLSELDALVDDLAAASLLPLVPPRPAVGTVTPIPPPSGPPPVPPAPPESARAPVPSAVVGAATPPPTPSAPPVVSLPVIAPPASAPSAPSTSQSAPVESGDNPTADFVEFGFDEVYDSASIGSSRVSKSGPALGKVLGREFTPDPVNVASVEPAPAASSDEPVALGGRSRPVTKSAFDIGDATMIDPGDHVFVDIQEGLPPLGPVDAPTVELSAEIKGAFEEFDFFMAQGLFDEAMGVIDELPADTRAHPDVVSRWQRLDAATANE